MLEPEEQERIENLVPEIKEHVAGIDPALVAYAKKEEATKIQSQEREAAKMLETLDEDFSLSAWGWTDELKITRGDKTEHVRLRIKSVGVQDVIENTEKKAPRPPSSMKSYKKGSAEALALGSQQAVIVREVDYSDPGYMEALDAHNRRSGQIILLGALAYDWYDPSDKNRLILKGADITIPNEIIDESKCLARLRRMGFTGPHYTIMLKNVRGLTEDEEAREAQE